MGRALRDIECNQPRPSEKFKELLSTVTRIYTQEKNDKQKLYVTAQAFQPR